MANSLLAPLYKDVYKEDFNPGVFNDRLKMQKTVYLLQEMGISVGDYSFFWYIHGPYSQELQNDIISINESSFGNILYSEEANEAIEKLSEVLTHPNFYNKENWAECLASLQYLRSNIVSINGTEDQLLTELSKRKQHLNNKQANKNALKELKRIIC
jgi:uncharacterized protein YwgA